MTKCCFLFLPFVLISTILMILMNLPHPIYAITMTLLYSMMLSMSMAAWKINYIAPIMFSLIMISGLMIIFMYFSSLISNAKHKMKKPPLAMMLTINLMIILIVPTHYSPLTQTPDLMHMNTTNQTIIDPMITMFLPPLQPLTLISMIYLLVTMMAIVKMCSPQSKSLRTKSIKT